VVGAAVRLALAPDGRVTLARVALGAVAPTAICVPEAEAALAGAALDEAALARLAGAVRRAARPIDDKRGSAAYRRQMIGVLARRAALRAAERAREAGQEG
jgi:carbon-monoxide dehydrogenase medium subunit